MDREKLSKTKSKAENWLKRNFILRQPVNHYRHISSEVLYNRYRTAGPGGDKLSRIAIGRLVHKTFSGVKKVEENTKADGRRYIYLGLSFKLVNVSSVWLDHTYSSLRQDIEEPPIPTVRAKEVRKPLGDITNCPPAADSSFDESEHDLPDDEDWLPSESDDEEEEVAISNDSTVDWKSHLPAELAADADWLHFFLQQVKNCGKYKRWSVTLIQIALDLFTRSPTAYTNLKKTLRLPSSKHLQRYKNYIKQKPGIVPENLHWMALEAKRKGLSKSGRDGFIVFDEVALQPDLQLESWKADSDMYGTTDYGDVQGMHMLRKFGGVHVLATHVLQFMFLGSTGFRWPVCYFATTEAHASELVLLVWEVVNAVQSYGFKVSGLLMDGSANNRKFLDIQQRKMYPEVITLDDYRITNPVYIDHYVHVMLDPMHGVKKVRNCENSSKVGEYRRLRWGRYHSYWSHYEDAYEWDKKTNPLAVYHRLTEEHVYLSDSGKMRNHLATDVCNKEMLHLMQEYKIASGREDLELTLKILEHISIITENFLRTKPITSTTDPVFTENRKAIQFFIDWEVATKHDPRCFLTTESYEDLMSSVLVFEHMALKRLHACPGAQIVPAIMNSDVIENLFSSQRGRCNGANTNPTLKVYSKSLNTIILTSERCNVNKLSKKNAATQASVGGAHPYHILAGRTFRQNDP